MNPRSVLCLSSMIWLASACNSSGRAAQVDDYWLSSWEKAQETRPREMSASAEIAPQSEPGKRLIVRDQLFKPDGTTPADGVVVHAYHRDAQGFDFGPGDNALPTWRLQGWVRTDAEGRFVFHTIRPAPDHLGREGSHVHFTLDSAQFGWQWAPTVFLADDPLVSARQRSRSAELGEFAWVLPVTTVSGSDELTVRLRLKPKGEF